MHPFPDRLTALRAELARQGVDGCLVPRADEHLGEYVPPSAARLAWLTGFTGSAGLAVVLGDQAALFTDGRYVTQAAAEIDPALWQVRHVTTEPPPRWIKETAPGARIGYDPWLISEEALARYTDAGIDTVALERNPVDAVWPDRPPPPAGPALPYPIALAGDDAADKRSEIAGALREAGQDAAVISDPASIAWLFNLRGEDVAFTPVALGFALMRADATATLFMAPGKLPAETRAWLGNAVACEPPAALPEALAALRVQKVRVDPAGTPAWFARTLREAGAIVADGPDPCLLPKASKNTTEQAGARAAHARDAVAICRFLHWFSAAAPAGGQTESAAAARLLALRSEGEHFRGESFPAIAGAGEHGAIIHYRVTPATDRPIRAHELFLIDSGAQYLDGTTDITRTLWTGPGAPPEAPRERWTRVLQGMIAIATLVFPEGLTGAHLDAFARRALWQAGLDYDHGTGHGVGAYLSVHEGPASLSRLSRPVPIAPGMILSDEPGLYVPGEYGIRLENLLLVQPAELPGAAKPFLRFETLTLAPFDRRMVLAALLTPAEREWLDAYHARVLAEIGPQLDPPDRAWLAAACAALDA